MTGRADLDGRDGRDGRDERDGRVEAHLGRFRRFRSNTFMVNEHNSSVNGYRVLPLT